MKLQFNKIIKILLNPVYNNICSTLYSLVKTVCTCDCIQSLIDVVSVLVLRVHMLVLQYGWKYSSVWCWVLFRRKNSYIVHTGWILHHCPCWYAESICTHTHTHTRARAHKHAQIYVLPFSVPTFLPKHWRSQTAILTIMLGREVGSLNH
jgi:hypothetical protein